MKAFRSNLTDFFSRLLRAAHDSEILYDDAFCGAIQSWLVAMSSSPLRAFRHTATVISLAVVSDLASLLNDITKELASVSRQVSTEKAASRKDKGRIKEWEQKQKQVHEHKELVETFITEFFDGCAQLSPTPIPAADVLRTRVFIHRYRDADPQIRIECVKALGEWMKHNPAFFLEGNYLRYIGWVLTDDVRLPVAFVSSQMR